MSIIGMTGYIHTSGTLRVTSLSRPITGVDGVCQLFPDANCGLAGEGLETVLQGLDNGIFIHERAKAFGFGSEALRRW